jgi:hypothetical protein
MALAPGSAYAGSAGRRRVRMNRVNAAIAALRRGKGRLFPGAAQPAHFAKHGLWDPVASGLLIEYEILSALARTEVIFFDPGLIDEQTGSFPLGDTTLFFGFLEDRRDMTITPRYYLRFILWVMRRSWLIDEIPWMPDHYRILIGGRLVLRFPYLLRFVSRTSLLTHKNHHLVIGSKLVMTGVMAWVLRLIILVISVQYLVPLWHAFKWYLTGYIAVGPIN